ncbi:MAG: IgGFc-binding protein, partial [Bacteroidales bacterium]|nr:IgGFc-binding protein [Bacteroidales bacterium]
MATDTVSVYASNFHAYSYDVTNILPTPTLQDEYVLQFYAGSSVGENEFVVMAVEDNTTFQVRTTQNCNHVATRVSNGRWGYRTENVPQVRANNTYTYTLNAGETRTFVTLEGVYDLSGTTVKASDCKKLAVFVGNTHTCVPSSVSAADHLVEQAIPVNYWGKKYVVTTSLHRLYDRYRITSLENGCEVKVNGSVRTTLAANQTVEYEISQGSVHYIETSKPVAVYLYMMGGQRCATYSGVSNPGDPSMTLINPIEQQVSEITFGTFRAVESGTGFFHFVNIVAESDDVSGITLDGASIATSFSAISGTPYSYARISVSDASHTLRASSGGFVAHVYGIGNYEGYAYSVGSSAIDLNRRLWVKNGEAKEMLTSSLESGVNLCANDEPTFRVETNYDVTSVKWIYGDGSDPVVTTSLVTNHKYLVEGTYTVKAVVSGSLTRCDGTEDTLTTEVHVHGHGPGEVSHSICTPDTYTWNDVTYDATGDYTKTGLVSDFGCDSSAILHLTVNTSSSTRYSVEACDTYTWSASGSNGHGTGTSYSVSGVYTGTSYVSDDGCPSVDTLVLSIKSSTSGDTNATKCDAFTWYGNSYTSSATPIHTITNSVGCDSVVTLHLTINRSTTGDTTATVCDQFSWYEHENITASTETLKHTFSGGNAARCDSVVTLHLTINSSTSGDTNATKCDAFTWYSNSYTSNATPTHTITNSVGCDSVVTLHLTINRSTTGD